MRFPIFVACLALPSYLIFPQSATGAASRSAAGMHEQHVLMFSGNDKPTLGNTLLGIKIVPQGAVSSDTDSWLNTIMVNPDNLAQSGDGAVDGFEIFHQLGEQWIGSRDALDVSLTTSALASQPGTTFLTALRTTVAQFHGIGGNFGHPIGDLYGANFNVNAAAPYPASSNGLEIDIQNEGPALAIRRSVGVAVGYGPRNELQGAEDDAAFSVWVSPGGATSRTTGPKTILRIGRTPNGAWPFVNGDGSIVSTGQLSIGYGSGLATPPNVATHGIDFSKVHFKSDAWWSPGYRVNGTGEVSVGAGEISPTPNGLRIAVSGQRTAAVAVADPGTRYRVGDEVYDGLGGIIRVDRVSNVGGIVVAHYLSPAYATEPPQNPVRATGGSGNGKARFTVTWKPGTQVQIGDANADILLGSGRALPAAAKTGMVMVPTVSDTPTGSVGAAGQAALLVDTRNSKICANWGQGWKCAELR